MPWEDAISEIFNRLTTSGGAATAPADPHADYSAIAKVAPPNVVADGLTQAFQSDRTPSFPEMVSSLFRNSNPDQKAGLLNNLLGAINPAALASVPGLNKLSGTGVTPADASRISADQVQQAAAQAHRDDPSIINRVSGFYAQHPDVVKALGGAAITIAIQSIARRK
jgi:hypothetical protein